MLAPIALDPIPASQATTISVTFFIFGILRSSFSVLDFRFNSTLAIANDTTVLTIIPAKTPRIIDGGVLSKIAKIEPGDAGALKPTLKFEDQRATETTNDRTEQHKDRAEQTGNTLHESHQ